MTTDHLIGYAFSALLVLLLFYAAFGEYIVRRLSWVKRLERVQTDWRQLRLDLSQIADRAFPPPQGPLGSKLDDVCVLPASKVFRRDELLALQANYHTIANRQTWRILGASAFPRERVDEAASHLRVYVVIFLLLVGYNIFGLLPNTEDLSILFSSSVFGTFHTAAGTLGAKIGTVVAVKEAVIIGFFGARLHAERSTFNHFAKE
ncbi:MAG: hypothetical protein JNL84_13790 [Candidatus Accumulibacter sp.]|nr:hypothetical protein [Accumulibacter sp.]